MDRERGGDRGGTDGQREKGGIGEGQIDRERRGE